MRFGFALPQVGSAVGPEALVTVAKRAEDLGFDSLWVLDRILWPVNPRAPYPIGDGSLPVKYKSVLDPLETLTFAAAHTRRVALGTSVLNLPWYTPVLLARQLTTLDILSAGRLKVGFGIGWSPDEYEAAGAMWQERGKRADELIQALKNDRSGGISGEILSYPKIRHWSETRAETPSPDLHGGLYAFSCEARCS
jgi:alkanesulfonate monooxygenase SsuD/methylene tetrahydromethanopterin reductase-like flavin-dependent oxidoreductase (luciferase family)